MVDNNSPYEGEYWNVADEIVKIRDVREDKWFWFGEYFTPDGGKTPEKNYYNPSSKVHRKATKEEIIERFNKKENDMNVNDKKRLASQVKYSQQSNREIIGYKVKSGLAREVVMNLVGAITPYSFYDARIDFQPNSIFYDKAINLCILDQLFETVYKKEEIQFKTGDWVAIADKGQADLGCLFTLNTAYQLTEDFIELNGLKVAKDNGGGSGNGWPNAFSLKMKLRRATKEEIETAKEAQIKKIILSCEGVTFEIEVSKKGIYYRPDNRYIGISELKSLVAVTKLPGISVAGYLFTPIITHMDAGCKKKTLLSDWIKVIEEYEKILRS